MVGGPFFPHLKNSLTRGRPCVPNVISQFVFTPKIVTNDDLMVKKKFDKKNCKKIRETHTLVLGIKHDKNFLTNFWRFFSGGYRILSTLF